MQKVKILIANCFRNVTSGDDGSYECQVSMQKKMSQFVFLRVLRKKTALPSEESTCFLYAVPTVSIDGPPEVFTKSGSTVQLICRVANHKQLVPIIW